MPAVSESYAPVNVIRILEKQKSTLMEKFAVRASFRAIYDGSGNKLIQAESGREWFFRPVEDPGEQHPLPADELAIRAKRLRSALELFLDRARQRRPAGLKRSSLAVQDERLKNRLRNLGYLE
jgi:hypothetical protein